MEKFSSLDIFQIKEILLESAARSFIMDEDNYGKRKKLDETIYNKKYKNVYTFVYESQADLDADQPNLKKLMEKGLNIKTNRFLPSLCGKGILDLRAAFVYGQLLVDDLKRIQTAQAQGRKAAPRLTPEQLRSKMKKILRTEEVTAANTIKDWFKKQKQLKNLEA